MQTDDLGDRLEALRAAAGTWWGAGDGPESGPFTGRVEVLAQAGSVVLTYEAWSPEQGLQHQERAEVSGSDGGLHLVTVTSELPGAVRFQHDGTRFTSPGTAAYALAVDLAVVGDELTWAWHWAPTGRPPTMQSQLRATRTA